MVGAGIAFACTSNLLLLILAGTIGVISPSGNEVGPFLSIEQAALSHVVPAGTRTEVFAWYALAGSLATATGALCGGTLTHALQKTAMRTVVSYRIVVVLYAALGVLLALVFTRLSSAAEVSLPGEESVFPETLKSFFGIGRSRQVVVVNADERSAAAGITGVARTTGAAISPLFVGFMFTRHSLINLPFFVAGTLKVIYDLLLYKEFIAIQPEER